MTVTINDLIKSPKSEVFRKAYIKRRDPITAQYENTWFDISSDVKSFGKITKQMDYARRSQFKFGTLKLTVNNENGRYNSHLSESSHWYGYLNQQRTLFKINAGFYSRIKNDYGVWRNRSYPGESLWDVSEWDAGDALWDSQSTTFIGILVGDIPLSDNNQISFNIKPLNSIFEDFPARNLTGWTSTGMTASQFITMVRDQTDGSGYFIFRPFFGDTTSNWSIQSTTNVYTDLNTSTAQGVFDSNVWEVIEKLAEAENFVPYVSNDGTFKFVTRNPSSTALSFEFHGAGSFSNTYGNTIKSISSFGPKLTKYYSRAEVKYQEADTVTSYQVVEGSYSVSPASNAWVLGNRTLKIENLFIPDSATALTIATNVFNDVSSLRNEIDFTTSFIPHLDVLDRFSITYDPTEFNRQSLWDQNNWADDTTTASESDLIWDKSTGDAIILQGDEFRFLSIEVDLDNLSSKFIAREV